jgi:phosphinothricin acetyltransferase
MSYRMRPATRGDLPAILAIYNYAVRHLPATFEVEERSAEAQEAWFAAHDDRHPVLVAEDDRHVVGWAALSPFSERVAYARTVENSVYVHRDHWGRGVGTLLMGALMQEARVAGHHVVVARIVGDNAASIRLHARFGFTTVGTLHEVGWKFGRWHDVLIMEAILPEAKA